VKPARPLALGLLLIFGVAASARAMPSRAAVVSGAALESRGAIVELHFNVRGRRPAWYLNGQRQQLALTLEHTRLDIPAAPLAGQERSPVTAVRAAMTSDGTVQLLIDVSGKVDYAVAFAPHDLIVRFAKAGAAPDIAAPLVIPAERVRSGSRRARGFQTASAVPPPPPPVVASSVVAAAPPVVDQAPSSRTARPPLVVIDPGHGGRDPGTRSASGSAEKDLALQIAIRLQRVLSGLGVTARLTRADDRFLSLAERTQAANRNAADLFISIHLNASPERAASGIATYYLNNTTDRATIRLARMENSVAGGYGNSAMPNLNYILTDLRQGDKANESVALSRMIEAESVAAAGATLGVRVNNLGARQGPFYVLVGAEMPAVLVECGFLSNADEAARLAEGDYQQALADGIAAAVTHYFNGDAAVGNL
jgi:N-acetylmuramoyl-L-alanine amidase